MPTWLGHGMADQTRVPTPLQPLIVDVYPNFERASANAMCVAILLRDSGYAVKCDRNHIGIRMRPIRKNNSDDQRKSYGND